MAQDLFFNKVGLQLITIPESSRRTLDDLDAGKPLKNPPDSEQSLISARGWLEAPFLDCCKAPPRTKLAAIRAENACCDVIRARYQNGGYAFEVAQSRYLLNIKISGFPARPGLSPAQRAEQAARQVLAVGDRVRLATIGQVGELIIGKQSLPENERVDPQWPHWIDSLRWWSRRDEIGFLTLKSVGGPTREVIGPFEEMNQRWFVP